MNNINLEKFLYKTLQDKGYNFYYTKTYNPKDDYVPQIYAVDNKVIKNYLLTKRNWKNIDLSTQKTHNFIHKRPLVIVKSINGFNVTSDNALLCSILKKGISQLNAKDINSSLEKYLINVQTLALIENVFSTSEEKFSALKLFSKNMLLQNTHLKHLDNFLNKHCSPQDKEEFIFSFISKRSKELQDIVVDKKITGYLFDTWSDNNNFLQRFIGVSPYLSNKLEDKKLDIFDSYEHSIIIGTDISQASKILGLTTNKISAISEKFFKAVEQYHKGNLDIIVQKDKSSFVLRHNDPHLQKEYLQNLYKQFLVQVLDNISQKIDTTYCEKWYLLQAISKKLPEKNTVIKVNKI